MLGLMLIFNLILTSILAFTHWLAVYIKKNPYLISLATYNTSLVALFLLYVSKRYDANHPESVAHIFLLVHIVVTSYLIYSSWKEEIKDEIVK